MLDTPSLFDALEVENTDHRVASRRALALAHQRVERNLGRFLRAAQTEEEFVERLSLVQGEFDGYITTASGDVGHEHPNHIAAALKDHYRLAAEKVKFIPTPGEEQEKEDEEEAPVTANTEIVTPVVTPKSSRSWQVISDISGQPGMPLGIGQEIHPDPLAQQGAGALPGMQPQPVQPNPDQQPAPNAMDQVPGGAQQGAGVAQMAQQMEGVGNIPQPTQPPAPQPPVPGQPPQMPNGSNPMSLMGAAEDEQRPPLVSTARGWDDSHSFPLGEFADQNDDPRYVPPVPLDPSQLSQEALRQHQNQPNLSDEARHRHDQYIDDGLTADKSARLIDPEWEQDQNVRPVPRWAGAEDAYGGGAGGYELPMDRGPNRGYESPIDRGTNCPECRGHHVDENGRCLDCGHRVFNGGNPWAGYAPDDHGPMDSDPYDNESHYPRMGSEEQSHQLVTCPECGGDGKTAGATKCGKCKGEGKVPNFGDSVLDAYFGADQNNTNLDGPEPKMDKRLWTPSAPGKPDTEDGSRHPTKEKDVTEVIGPMRNDHELQEIHGQDGHFEEQKLPTQTGDTPFAENNMESGPHTDTFNNDGQVDPVTREALSSLSTPFLAATQRESMGMSAQDFRMLADAIRTAPEGADKSTLAGHVAQYLQHTNPLFDGDRFLQAAIGQPASGRDTYRGPGGQDPSALNADLNGPGGFGEQLGQGLGLTGNTDNPLKGMLSSVFPPDSVVTDAFLRLQN